MTNSYNESLPAHEDKLKKDSQLGLEIYLWVHATRKDTRAPTTFTINWKPRFLGGLCKVR